MLPAVATPEIAAAAESALAYCVVPFSVMW
jgi:hypothetical protein